MAEQANLEGFLKTVESELGADNVNLSEDTLTR